MLRFHLDENVDVALAKGLRLRGIDVTLASEVGLLSASDEAHISFAVSTGRVIITHDDDFLSLAQLGIAHAGIGYCTLEARSVGELVRYLLLMCDCLEPEEMIGRIEYL